MDFLISRARIVFSGIVNASHGTFSKLVLFKTKSLDLGAIWNSKVLKISIRITIAFDLEERLHF